MKRKLKLVILPLMVFMLTISFVNSSLAKEDPEDKKLRTGSCFCDGEESCKERKVGLECALRDRCAAMPCVDLIIKIVITGGDKIVGDKAP